MPFSIACVASLSVLERYGHMCWTSWAARFLRSWITLRTQGVQSSEKNQQAKLAGKTWQPQSTRRASEDKTTLASAYLPVI